MTTAHAIPISHAMIMAAGLGTRLKPFTNLRPKPLLPLMGVPMVQFAIDALAEAGVTHVVINYHAHPLLAQTELSKLDRPSTMRIDLSDESKLLMGSAGGLKKALPLLGDKSFFILNADTLCDISLSALAEKHLELRKKHSVLLTLAVFRKPPLPGQYREIFWDPSSELITGLGELETNRPFFAGAAVIEPEALEHLPLNKPSEFVPDILHPAIAQKKVGVFVTEGHWLDIGSPQLWHAAHLFLIQKAENNALPKLWKNRLYKENIRLKPGVWGSKKSAPYLSADAFVQGPSYLASAPSTQPHWPAGTWGPGLICYGTPPDPKKSHQQIISYFGVSIEIE